MHSSSSHTIHFVFIDTSENTIRNSNDWVRLGLVCALFGFDIRYLMETPHMRDKISSTCCRNSQLDSLIWFFFCLDNTINTSEEVPWMANERLFSFCIAITRTDAIKTKRNWIDFFFLRLSNDATILMSVGRSEGSVSIDCVIINRPKQVILYSCVKLNAKEDWGGRERERESKRKQRNRKTIRIGIN